MNQLVCASLFAQPLSVQCGHVLYIGSKEAVRMEEAPTLESFESKYGSKVSTVRGREPCSFMFQERETADRPEGGT